MVKSSFKESLKSLEADIQHANTLALDYPREKDGACIQMRLSYSSYAQFFIFLVQWTHFNLAGTLGLLRILIYVTYPDGKTTMSVYERKASVRQFYGTIFPSLLLLQRGVTDLEYSKQKEVCATKYRRKDELDKGKLSKIDIEREEECGICLETNMKFVLPNCCHTLCLTCYEDWCVRSKSCPFCRDSLKKVNADELWVYTETRDIIDLSSILRENCNRLFMYIDNLPLVLPDPAVYNPYDNHSRLLLSLETVWFLSSVLECPTQNHSIRWKIPRPESGKLNAPHHCLSVKVYCSGDLFILSRPSESSEYLAHYETQFQKLVPMKGLDFEPFYGFYISKIDGWS
ncbi:hypothetical protein ACFE04_013412 [Oxalis oulophora]